MDGEFVIYLSLVVTDNWTTNTSFHIHSTSYFTVIQSFHFTHLWVTYSSVPYRSMSWPFFGSEPTFRIMNLADIWYKNNKLGKTCFIGTIL
jgi:hypothetical protein